MEYDYLVRGQGHRGNVYTPRLLLICFYKYLVGTFVPAQLVPKQETNVANSLPDRSESGMEPTNAMEWWLHAVGVLATTV